MKKIIIILLVLVCGSAIGQTMENLSPEMSYKAVLQEEDNIKKEIQSVTEMLPSLRGGKAKKAAKRLDELVSRQEALQRLKLFYPESVKAPQQTNIDEKSREQVRQMIDEKVLAKGGSLEQQEFEQPQSEEFRGDYWSVVLSISSSPDASKYKSYGEVEVERMAGRYFFFLGYYKTKSEADSKCKQIVKKGKIRDAFVMKRSK